MEEIPPGNSVEEAEKIAKRFIDDHQWEEIDKKDDLILQICRYWDGKFGYRIGKFATFVVQEQNCSLLSYEEAKKAGEKARNKMIIKLEEESAAGERRKQLKKDRPDLFE